MGANTLISLMGSFLRKNTGWLAILVLSLLPVARWAVMLPLEYRFSNASSALTSLGQVTGLVGMAMFSINLILSGRMRFLDRYFSGLNKVYSYHHVIGAVSFSLLLFHPLFLAARLIPFSLRSAALFLLPSQNWAANFGIIALSSMMILMILTFFVKLKYHVWKFSHKFMVAVFAFALLHSFYATSDISRDLSLRFYILGLGVAGLSVGFYKSFLSKYFNNYHKYEITKLSQLGPGVLEVEMASREKAIDFEPGQFVFVSFKSSGVDAEVHPFSISSGTRGNLKLVIKSLGDFTAKLGNLKTGDHATIEGPFGKFSCKEAANKNQIWIAGGIGITPFLSMARSPEDGGRKIDLYYCTKNKEEAVLAEELAKIGSANKNFRMMLWLSNDRGFITGADILRLSGNLDDKDIFLCGPPVFMESLRKQFLQMGVKDGRIHWEKFNFF